MYTLTEAAAATGRHKSTILRALQAGKVASTRDAHNNYQIDRDALFDVYPARTDSAPVAEPADATSAPVADAQIRNESTIAHQATARLEALEAINSEKAEQVDHLKDHVADLQRRLDLAESDRRRLEEDRRAADDNATRQVDQLSQLLAMREKNQRQLQLEQQESRAENRGWLAKLFR